MNEWDFSGDEWLFFVAAVMTGLFFGWRWYRGIILRSRLRKCAGVRFSLAISPILALLATAFIIDRWGDPKTVAGHIDYELLFLAGGAAWIFVILAATPLFGFRLAEDAIDQASIPVSFVAIGAIFGISAIYSASNIGTGPTIWTTLLPAFVATLTWITLWLILEILSRASDIILIDRDLAAAIRLSALLFSNGLILGSAMAGDWASWPDTFSDFLHRGWPAVPLTIIAILVNRFLKPSPTLPTRSPFFAGLISGAFFLAIAIFCGLLDSGVIR